MKTILYSQIKPLYKFSKHFWFRCQCPLGLKGSNCDIIDNPCDKNNCQNNGICIYTKLRSPGSDEINQFDDIYKEFICKCPPYFYGKLCEIFVIPDYALKFASNGINDYVQIQGPEFDLTEVSNHW